MNLFTRRSKSFQQSNTQRQDQQEKQYNSSDINEVLQLDQWKTLNSAYKKHRKADSANKNTNEIKSVQNEQNYYLYQIKNNSKLLNSILASKLRIHRSKSYNLMNRSGKSSMRQSEHSSLSLQKTNDLLNSFSGFYVFNQIPLNQIIKIEDVQQELKKQNDNSNLKQSRQMQGSQIVKSQKEMKQESQERVENLKQIKTLTKKQKQIQDEILQSKESNIKISNLLAQSTEKYYKKNQEMKEKEVQKKVNIKNIVNKLIVEENYKELQNQLSEKKLNEEINLQDQKQLLDEISMQYKDTLEERGRLFKQLEQEYVYQMKLHKNEYLVPIVKDMCQMNIRVGDKAFPNDLDGIQIEYLYKCKRSNVELSLENQKEISQQQQVRNRNNRTQRMNIQFNKNEQQRLLINQMEQEIFNRIMQNIQKYGKHRISLLNNLFPADKKRKYERILGEQTLK